MLKNISNTFFFLNFTLYSYLKSISNTFFIDFVIALHIKNFSNTINKPELQDDEMKIQY